MDMEFLGGSPYRYCKKLKKATVPNCVTDTTYWFSGLDSLEEIVLGKGVGNCDGIPLEKMKSVTFLKKTGWCTKKGYGDEAVLLDPSELESPKSAALLLYRLKKSKATLSRTDFDPLSRFDIFLKPNVE